MKPVRKIFELPLCRFLASTLCATGVLACASSEDDDPAIEDPGPGGGGGGKADSAFANGPMFVTGAFDGSKSTTMWVNTMDFARQLETETGKKLKWTYFINTAYYSRTVTGSDIGIAESEDAIKVRWALTQQAANEGHEIANHTVRHKNGEMWSEAQWKTEIDEFHKHVESSLFVPVLDAQGKPLFPVWKPATTTARKIGAACTAAGDCESASCAMVTPTQGFCTKLCSSTAECGNGTICGGSCLPRPAFPVMDANGGVLFDAAGKPNLANPLLKPYKVIGFRAPQLGHNVALFKTLEARSYRYDTSQILPPGPPVRTKHAGQVFARLYQFALMKHEGGRTVPMDYNYHVNNATGDRMLADYKTALVRSYNDLRRVPWNIGHHFSLWQGGAYWRAMKDAFRYAAQGCPEGGVKKCEKVEFVTFEQLANKLDNRSADEAEDIFLNPDIAPDGTEFVPESCEEDAGM